MRARKWIPLAAGATVFSMASWGFGGEDVAQGHPWHHEDITERALTGADALYADPPVEFTASAAASIAWHSDFIDSYLYNPVFWAQGAYQSSAVQRTKAALVGFKDLAKLHFDDTFTNSGLQANWERYAMGTLIGLVWASELPENEGIAAGHNILGVSFHAVQDFYSHSSWESDTRYRCLTYFQTPKDQRDRLNLYSGAYEKPSSGAPAHHGAYSLSCSILRGDDMDSALGTLCGGLSPLQNTSICDKFRACSGAEQVIARLEDPISDGQTTIWTNPPGIAIDNTALTRAQAPNRGLIGADGQFLDGKDGIHFPKERCTTIIASEGGSVCQAGGHEDADLVFAAGKDVAIRATQEWADYLETQMNKLGKGAFWNKLKTRGSADAARYAQFEDFSKLPYQFLAAGDYPIGNPRRDLDQPASAARGWFLRLRIRTADEIGAGTDADIYARVTTESGTQDVLLDYLPTDDKDGRATNRLLVYNDFERGDDDVYTIGPFQSRPVSIALHNESAGFTDVLDALATDFTNGVSETLTDARQALISLIGGKPDFVGSRNRNYTAETLKQRMSGGQFSDSLDVDGGDEGHHAVHFTIRDRSSTLTEDEREDGWVAAEVRLVKLHTIEESEVDRGSDSDEPFVIFHIAPLNGLQNQSYTYLSAPFEDMDDDEEEPFPSNDKTRRTIKIPPEGILVLSTAIYESDDETIGDRRTLMTKFVTGMDKATQRPASEFTDALGRSIAEDWVVDSIEAYAFHRSVHPLAGPVLARTQVGEIDGDETSEAYVLDWSQLTDFAAAGVDPILSLEAEAPSAKAVLEGKWHSNKFQCGGELPYVRVEIDLKEDDTPRDIIARKIDAEGDECINEEDGEEGQTFRGRFEDGVIMGERFIRPPPEHRPMEYDPDSRPLDRMPNYADTADDPQIKLEGNWFVTWSNSDETPALVALTKGGSRKCWDYEDGCWYHWKREPDAAWKAILFQPDGSSSSSDEITMSAGGAMTVDWSYSHLGNWGGKSTLQASDNSIRGSWRYSDEENGEEHWVRINSAINEVEVRHGDEIERKPVGEPVTVRTQWRNTTYHMRGNRSGFSIRFFGPNLWGVQRVFMPRYRDLEVSGVRYVCEWDGETGYESHPNWGVCIDQGGVRGIQVNLNVWPKATTGPHEIFINGEAIPFNLVVENEPLRYPEWQPMKMEFQSCSVLQEVDRGWDDQPFRLVRQDFRPREERGED